MTTQQKRRNKRFAKRDARKGGWHAFFSQEAFDMPPTRLDRGDGSTELCSRGNWYLRKDGTPVLITMVARNRNARYFWKDKQYLGRVHSWSKCIWHPEDPRVLEGLAKALYN